MNKEKLTIKKFFLLLVGTIIATKIWVISVWLIFQNNPAHINRIVNDPIHHYQVGLILLLLSYPLRKLIKPRTLSAIGLGIVLEELPVFLDDLGLGTLEYYNSGWDVLFILMSVFLVYKMTPVFKKHV